MGKKQKDVPPLSNNQNANGSKALTTPNANGLYDDGIEGSKKNLLSKTIKKEFDYLQQLFNVLDIANINQSRKSAVDGDNDDDDKLELADIPEKKIFKKTPSKKSAKAIKNKSYPQSIEGIEKELEELKGEPTTYQKRLRKKGLQIRLTKKRKKENKKKQKAALKQGRKLGGPRKPIKPVLNSEGNIVSNKFDFADNDGNKEIKRKRSNSVSDAIDENSNKKKIKNNLSNSLVNENVKIDIEIKKESDGLQSNDKNRPEDIKQKRGPLFNKDNKMVFSKILVSDGNPNKPKKKKQEKDPKKILQKIKEETIKISEIEKEDKEKAVIIKEKQKWSTALKRASGEKVKDDPELLKKSIIKEKNIKKKSQKKWQSRLDKIQKDKDERQKKRKDNIQERIKENKKRKLKKAIKKGRFIPI